MTRRSIRSVGNLRSIPSELWDSAFMRACRGEPADRVPVWLMRQAGRYMAEYRAVRADRDFLGMCEPTIAAEVTVTARNRIDADAAIIFADILLILKGFGQDLSFVKGEGPQLAPPIRSAQDLDRLAAPGEAAARCAYVAEACRLTRQQLPADVPLIGFCGAPFTVASYAIEGAGSRQWPQTRSLMYTDPTTWHRLQDMLVAALGPYLCAQVEGGAQALQIFDSWVGNLTEADYREFVLPHLQDLVAMLPEGIPVICFGTGTAHLTEAIAASGCDVLGVDHSTDLAATWDRLGGPAHISIQGNLDPAALLAPPERLRRMADAVLATVGDRPGFIFNLGHGVFKETDVDRVIELIAHVHARSQHPA
jgi:uroporphyrinogen decarboxylase